jgi:hypothetical protein
VMERKHTEAGQHTERSHAVVVGGDVVVVGGVGLCCMPYQYA